MFPVPARFLTLMGTVRAILGDIKNKRLAVETVTSAFEAAYVVELVKLIEAEILRPYALRHEEFIRQGKELLGEVRFNQVMDRVEAQDLGVEVLVAGLDGWAQTQLFSVSPRGVVSPSVLPYHAIGSGAAVALGSLYPLAYFPTHELPDTVYWACAAKFTAEITRSVGESTYAAVISPLHGTWTLVSELDRLRELWKSKGRPPIPSEARRLIDRDLRRLDFDKGQKAQRGKKPEAG